MSFKVLRENHLSKLFRFSFGNRPFFRIGLSAHKIGLHNQFHLPLICLHCLKVVQGFGNRQGRIFYVYMTSDSNGSSVKFIWGRSLEDCTLVSKDWLNFPPGVVCNWPRSVSN